MNQVNEIPTQKIIEKQGVKIYITVPPPEESGYTIDECVDLALEKFPDTSEITISFPTYYPRKPDAWTEAISHHGREYTKAVDDFSQAVDDFAKTWGKEEE